MGNRQMIIDNSTNADGFPVLVWTQEVLWGRTAYGRFLLWTFWMGFWFMAIGSVVVPQKDASEYVLERLAVSPMVGLMGGLGFAFVMSFLMGMGANGQTKEQTEENDRRATILDVEVCRAEIIRQKGIPVLRLKCWDRKVLMRRCEVLMMLLMTPLMPVWVRDKAALWLMVRLDRSALGKARPLVSGVKLREWSMPLASFEGFQLTREQEWFRTYKSDPKHMDNHWIIVADCGTRGMRVVAWHAGDKAFMARLHAELTEAFIGSRAAILDERLEAAPCMAAAMVPGKV